MAIWVVLVSVSSEKIESDFDERGGACARWGPLMDVGVRCVRRFIRKNARRGVRKNVRRDVGKLSEGMSERMSEDMAEIMYNVTAGIAQRKVSLQSSSKFDRCMFAGCWPREALPLSAPAAPVVHPTDAEPWLRGKGFT